MERKDSDPLYHISFAYYLRFFQNIITEDTYKEVHDVIYLE